MIYGALSHVQSQTCVLRFAFSMRLFNILLKLVLRATENPSIYICGVVLQSWNTLDFEVKLNEQMPHKILHTQPTCTS